MLQVAPGYLPHCETESGLMMVVPLGLVVKHPTHVHHDVTLTEDLQVPGPHNLGIAIFWQHLQEDASEDFVTVKGAIMCPNPDLSLELVTHLLDEICGGAYSLGETNGCGWFDLLKQMFFRITVFLLFQCALSIE